MGIIGGGRLSADVTVMSIIGHGLKWILISICTLGFGLMVFPYSFAKLVINRTTLTQSDGQAYRLCCNLNVMHQIVHVVLWSILTACTLGIAYPLYLYKVWNLAINSTSLERA